MSKIVRKFLAPGMPYMIQPGERIAKHFSDAEIIARAKADPDAQPLTCEQLAKFRRVNPRPRTK